MSNIRLRQNNTPLTVGIGSSTLFIRLTNQLTQAVVNTGQQLSSSIKLTVNKPVDTTVTNTPNQVLRLSQMLRGDNGSIPNHRWVGNSLQVETGSGWGELSPDLRGEGIQNFSGDPLAIYILAKS
jgi:hypothetical protein